jgi:hypothetical protein
MALQTRVKVAIADEPVALRLLSALVLGWTRSLWKFKSDCFATHP